jgi:hypothetical protein
MKELAKTYLGRHICDMTEEEQDDVRRLHLLRFVRLEGTLVAPGPEYIRCN